MIAACNAGAPLKETSMKIALCRYEDVRGDADARVQLVLFAVQTDIQTFKYLCIHSSRSRKLYVYEHIIVFLWNRPNSVLSSVRDLF
jgi:hypothetical protein